jgi:hypothetical protein
MAGERLMFQDHPTMLFSNKTGPDLRENITRIFTLPPIID